MEKKTLHEIVDKMKKRTLHEIADKHVYVPNCPSLAVLREQTFDLLDLLSAMYQIEDEERQKAFYGREIKRYLINTATMEEKGVSFQLLQEL